MAEGEQYTAFMLPDAIAEVEESEREVAFTLQRTGPKYGTTSAEDWAKTMERIRQHRIAKGLEALDGPVRAAEEPIVVTEALRAAELSEMPSKARAYATRILAKKHPETGESIWKVETRLSRTHKAPTLFVEDSDQDAPDPHRRGDIRFGAEDRVHYAMLAWAEAKGKPVVAVRVLWTQATKAGKEKPEPNKFEGAWSQDPIAGQLFHRTSTYFEEYLNAIAKKPEPKARKKPVGDE